MVNITQDSFQDQNSATESTEATQETAKTTKDFDIGPPQGNIFRIYIQGCTCIVGKGIEEIWNENLQGSVIFLQASRFFPAGAKYIIRVQ